MMRVTQKELRNIAKQEYCEDITHANDFDYKCIMAEEGWLDTLAYSAGIYGGNGKLYRGHNTGKLYAITTRSSAYFMFS